MYVYSLKNSEYRMYKLSRKAINENCRNYLSRRIENLKLHMKDLEEGSESESKSTAGDKHETGLAMMHLEMEQLATQLQNDKQMLMDLEHLASRPALDYVALGSIVHTDRGLYYISVPLGKVETDEGTIHAISTQSPLGKLLIAKTPGDSVTVNGITHRLERVF